jgi:hypothetical protein
MEAIIIDNKIYLVTKFDVLDIRIDVPKKNIQNMLDATKAILISKELTTLSYNHHAGTIYRCRIKVVFDNIRKYLTTGNAFSASNFSSYSELFHCKYGTHEKVNLLRDDTGLYTFGNCSGLPPQTPTTYYYYASGRQIMLNDNERTNFGTKRYLKNNNRWVSNRGY